MKKFFSILTVCAVFAVVACNNASETKTPETDTTVVVTPSVDTTKVIVDTTKVDTTKKM